jgi:hypothetical protein
VLRTAGLPCAPRDLTSQFRVHKLQRHDITFADNDGHVLLLRSSKSGYDHVGMEIVAAKSGEDTCPVSALYGLYTLDSQPQRAYFDRTTAPTRETNI